MIRLVILLLLAVMGLWSPLPAMAQEVLFTRDVAVTVNNPDAAKAREQALQDAEQKGFAELIESFAPEQKEVILKRLDPKKISSFVRGTEVIEEKITGAHYSARFRVNYSSAAVNKLLEQRTSEIESDTSLRSAGMLVIPILDEDGRPKLWEKKNDWRTIWSQVSMEMGQGGVLVPFGDNIDETALGVKGALTASYASFRTILARYGVGTAIVLTARYSEAPDQKMELIRRQVTPRSDEVQTLHYFADKTESRALFFDRVARDLAKQMLHSREAVLEHIAAAGEDIGQVLISVRVTSLKSANAFRARLNSLAMVKKVELVALSPDQTDLKVYYRGDKQGFANALLNSGLALTQQENYWTIMYE